MTVSDVLQLLRAGLLEGRAIALAGPARPEIAGALEALGARITPLEVDSDDERAQGFDALVVDAAVLFEQAPTEDELAPLRAAADGAWTITRTVANAAWIAPQRPGKLVLLAPAPDAGAHAGATRAALENLSRTLSIEWARFGIRTTTITPGTGTPPETLAALTAYLLSPAGDYFSGARLDLS